MSVTGTRRGWTKRSSGRNGEEELFKKDSEKFFKTSSGTFQGVRAEAHLKSSSMSASCLSLPWEPHTLGQYRARHSRTR
eukprot:1681674-Rhodomonas_salina.1